MNKLIEEIKKEEGFRGINYFDSLGIPTIGIGTKLPITEEEGELLLKHRLNKMISELLEKKPIILTLSQDRQIALFNLCYQVGVSGILKFKMMFLAIESHDFKAAAEEILNSKLAEQTPQRAERLAKQMRG